MRKHLLIALALLVTAFAGVARASHYALVDVPRLVKPGEIDKLKKANVTTTEELLGKAAKTKDRKALAKTTGLPGADLLALAKRWFPALTTRSPHAEASPDRARVA